MKINKDIEKMINNNTNGLENAKILAVDDNEDILLSIKLLLKPYTKHVVTISNPNGIEEELQKENFDVILLDMNFDKDVISGVEGFFWLKRILEIDPTAIVIFITAYGDIEKAVNSMKAGAIDFIIKPWHTEKLLATISSGIKLKNSRNETDRLKLIQNELSSELNQPFKDFVGNSTRMQEVFKTIKKVAKTDANILILGENGTGKEVVARAIHENSLRFGNIFCSVDLGSISENLFESELFGHVKGAFTDAKKDRAGRFEVASGGSLFLDEIGNISMQLQSKLLTVIEKKEVIRVGSNKIKSVDVRLICATNNDIHSLSRENKFRQDLLFRINTVEITLPPLRDREGDIELLANHFLSIFTKKYNKNIIKINKSVIKEFEEYNWPGNIRELSHVIERAVIMSESNSLQIEDIILSTNKNEINSSDTELKIDNYNLDEIEKNIILKVLKNYQGNITKAAKKLGLTRTSLYRRLEKHSI